MDPLLAARVRGQSGLVTRDQALTGGLTDKAIRWRLESGRWLRLHPGVYLTEPGRNDWSMHAVAALLHVGPPVALWGRSAGHAWSLLADPGDTISVVVPFARSGRPRDGIQVIRTRHMRERVDPSAWPHRTTAEDTVLDLSQGRSLDRAVALVSKARQLHLVTPASLLRALDHRPGQSHRSLVREALDEIGAGVESAAEYRYVRDVERAHGLPEGRRQEPAPGQRHRDSFYDLVTSSSRSTVASAMRAGRPRSVIDDVISTPPSTGTSRSGRPGSTWPRLPALSPPISSPSFANAGGTVGLVRVVAAVARSRHCTRPEPRGRVQPSPHAGQRVHTRTAAGRHPGGIGQAS